jgi:hypothetical protein
LNETDIYSELGVLTKDKNRWKSFCGLIYQKLDVSTRAEALNKSAELGDI